MFRSVSRTAAAALLMAAPAAAQSHTWTIDTAHSLAEFSVRHMMVSNVKGTFGRVSGTATWDGRNLSAASVDVVIDAASIDTRVAQRDTHLKSADFFDVERFPTLTFKSTKVESAGPGKAVITGDLTIRGVTRSVTLDVIGPAPEVKGPDGSIRIGASATASINRRDFGLVWNRVLDGGGVLVGDQVAITIEVELVRKSGA